MKTNFDDEAIEYAEKLRKWWSVAKDDKSVLRPPKPRFIALDMALLGGGISDESLRRRVKEGFFDYAKSPRVLVFREKHGDRWYFISSPDDYGKIALRIIKERNGWYGYNLKDYEAKEPAPPKMTIKEAKNLDDEVMRTVTRLWDQYERDKREAKHNGTMAALLKLALDGNPEAAVSFLASTRDGEYEGFEVVFPEVVSEDKT